METQSLRDLARHVALSTSCGLPVLSFPSPSTPSSSSSSSPSPFSPPKFLASSFAMHSISGSTTNSSSSSDDDDGTDRMELEAAEALAGLAAVATRESSESGTTKWGSKGKRARSSGQVKSESPHVDSPDLELNSSNYQVTATVVFDQADETDIHEAFKKAKIKHQPKLLTPSLTCEARTTAFSGSRSRKNLTEAEKEEKRLRRVLANRESARQTIRRRQALHEELSRRASDLSVENMDLKREKELALEKLLSLKNVNELLKTQMCQSVNSVREENFLQGVQNLKPKVQESVLQMALNIKSEVDENLDLKLANPDVSSSKSTSKVYCNNTTMEPFQLTPSLMPPVVQSLNSDQLAPVPCISMFASSLNSPDKKSYTLNSPLTPVYLLPYPWFVPVPYHHDGDVHRDSSAAENGKYNSITGGVSSNSGPVENTHSTLTVQAKTEIFDQKENGPGTSNNGASLLHMIDGHGAGVFGGHGTGSACSLLPNNLSNTAHVLSTGKHEQWFVQDSSQQGSQSLCSVPQMSKEPTFFFPLKMPEHTVAAAEARKRRKELTRFKNFTGRQYRLPC